MLNFPDVTNSYVKEAWNLARISSIKLAKCPSLDSTCIWIKCKDMAPQYSELEVVPNESSEFSQLPRVSIPPSYPEVVGTKEESFSSKEVEEINGQPKSQRRLLSRKWLWIVGSVVLLVIIAAVVGGVVGSRSKKKTVPASARYELPYESR